MAFDTKRYQQALQTEAFGRELKYFDTLPSTNTWGQAHLDELAHGTLIVAEQQTAGHGRRQREWVGDAGEHLDVSLCLKPEQPLPTLEQLSLVAGGAFVESLRALSGAKIELKWPNDLFYAGRKLGGILCEPRYLGSKLSGLILGFGINIRWGKDVPAQLKDLAVSLSEIPSTTTTWTRETVLASCLKHLEAWYQAWLQRQWPNLLLSCRHYLALRNQEVRIVTDGGDLHGTIKDLDGAGHLVLNTAEGTQQTISLGDVYAARH